MANYSYRTQAVPPRKKVSSAKGRKTKTKSFLVVGVTCFVLVVGLMVAFLYWSVPEEASAPLPEVAKKPQKVVRKLGENPKPIKRPVLDEAMAARRAAQAAERKAAVEKAKADFVKRPGALQLPDGKVLTFPVPKEGETRKVYAYGHTYECDHLGNFRDITPRKLFHTAFEANFLALAQENKPFIPAFLTGLDPADVKKMLLKPYVPIGDETEDEMRQLKAYDDLRVSVLEYMEQGGSFDDYVKDIANLERKQRQSQAMALQEIMKLVKDGKLADAKLMAQAADKLMGEKGFKPVRLPAHVKAALEQVQ